MTNQDEVDLVLLTKENEIHAALTERFATKGKRCLRAGESDLDYLSMVCNTLDNRRIQISMDEYRKKVIESFDMTDCKPVATPITKDLLRAVTADIEADKYLDTGVSVITFIKVEKISLPHNKLLKSRELTLRQIGLYCYRMN